MHKPLKFAYLISFLCMISACNRSEPLQRPNIIYIYTDQQSASMMSCAGNEWLKTPAMDYIAENGVRFTRAYTTNPVCNPARMSMMTGRFPGHFKDNEGRQARDNYGAARIPSLSEEERNSTVAAYLKKAGYDLAFGGKKHQPNCLDPDTLGFEYISEDHREKLAEEVAKYVKKEHDNPYFLVVSLINPHDICYMAIREFASSERDFWNLEQGKVELSNLDWAMKIPSGLSRKEFFESHCPPLPPNFEPQEEEPEAVRSLINRTSFRNGAREFGTDEWWRHHRWAYCRLTELVDRRVQVILDALKESGNEENTLIIFSSDHGDMDGSHRMEHKTALYEEAANIPFMVMWKGQIPGGRVDDRHLVSNGLDLLPTVCDYAGVEGAADPRGRSLRPLFKNIEPPWRETLGVESEIGRMVVDQDGFKYIRYDAEGIEEQLLNLNEDPYETTHFTNDPAYASKLTDLRNAFDGEWFPEVADQ